MLNWELFVVIDDFTLKFLHATFVFLAEDDRQIDKNLQNLFYLTSSLCGSVFTALNFSPKDHVNSGAISILNLSTVGKDGSNLIIII